VDGLPDWLAKRPAVSGIKLDGSLIRFVLAGDESDEADVLKDMIHDGFRVVAFGARRRTLEDAFMQVTKGLVQ
jgi:ABC-2 type transport system ATP-binding protein